MQAVILDQKKEGSATCYLCRVSLLDYIQSVPENYQDYDVQRGIVSNQYLDHMVDTVYERKHIPPIVLVCSDYSDKAGCLTINDYRILDGLQRTHRLKMILDSIDFLNKSEIDPSDKKSQDRFLRAYSKDIRRIGSNRQVFRKLMNYGVGPRTDYSAFFQENFIWLEVWVNLSDDEQVNKMLLLNAGHKSVSIKHQLELIFLSTYIEIEKIAPPGIMIKRERELSAIQYSKNRTLGEYHFSHIISAIIALAAGKIVNTNSDFIEKLQSDSFLKVDLYEVISPSSLKTFLRFLSKLDQILSHDFGAIGTKWLGREVVLIGLFGAIGAHARTEESTPISILDERFDQLPQKLSDGLRLLEYENARNSVELNKVNIGLSNKRAVYNAVKDILNDQPFKGWKRYFGGLNESAS